MATKEELKEMILGAIQKKTGLKKYRKSLY